MSNHNLPGRGKTALLLPKGPGLTRKRMKPLKTSDFDFVLPPELIAQHPAQPRDSARLLVMNRDTGALAHRHFYDLGEYLHPGDLLLLNDSRVLPARLYGHKEKTGGAIEFLLLEQKGRDQWEVMARPGKKAKPGVRFVFGEGLLTAQVLEELAGGNRLVQFEYEGEFYPLLERIGSMPLPHYITAQLEDPEDYQTVYSREMGSAAAPTAGLHFTQQQLQALQKQGVRLGYVTLHVGLGTFRPVKVEDVTQHKMHTEHFYLPQETADLILQTKAEGGRVIAVGTTSCRTVETVGSRGPIARAEGYTDIFIYPGYQFRVIDGLITNFHLPQSTLIMLVSALAGRERVLAAYEEAVRERYRFYSFGDAMLIAPGV